MHITIIGQGKPLVLLHGFGFNHTCFNDLIDKIKDRYQCFAVDLPGCGLSDYNPYTLDSLTQKLHDILPNKFSMLGWSLGGGIVLSFASQFPKRVNGVILVASNPLFIGQDNWPGMNKQAFNFFAKQCQRDYKKAQKIFLDLQQASNTSMAISHQYQISYDNNISSESATNALELLESYDLRKAFQTLSVPSLTMLGLHDQLVPAMVEHSLASLNNTATTRVFNQSAHAPFLTEQDTFIESMDNFLCNL